MTRLMCTTQGTSNLILKTCQACKKSCHDCPKSCHDWTFKKPCSRPVKSWHGPQIMSRFGTFPKTIFELNFNNANIKKHKSDRKREYFTKHIFPINTIFFCSTMEVSFRYQVLKDKTLSLWMVLWINDSMQFFGSVILSGIHIFLASLFDLLVMRMRLV